MPTMTREQYLQHVNGNGTKSGNPKRRRHNPDVPIVVPPNTRRVLAIDPGQKLGWAVVDVEDTVNPFPWRPGTARKLIRIDSGRWSPSASKNAPDKRTQLWAQLRALYEQYVDLNSRPNRNDISVAIEMPNPNGLARGKAFSRTSLVSYGLGIGIVVGTMMSLHRAGGGGSVLCPSVEQWKGRKSKEQTAADVAMLTGFRSDDDNEMDALGLAAWVLRQV